MKILIAYVSRNGTVKRCADMLEKYLPSDVDAELCDLLNIESTENILDGYGAVALLGSVRMGSIDKKIKAILKKISTESPDFPCALGISCGYSDRYDEYKGTQLPRGYFPTLGVHDLGGELKPDNLSGFDRIIVKHMRKKIKELDFEDSSSRDICLPEIMPENIKALAEKFKNIK